MRHSNPLNDSHPESTDQHLSITTPQIEAPLSGESLGDGATLREGTRKAGWLARTAVFLSTLAQLPAAASHAFAGPATAPAGGASAPAAEGDRIAQRQKTLEEFGWSSWRTIKEALDTNRDLKT